MEPGTAAADRFAWHQTPGRLMVAAAAVAAAVAVASVPDRADAALGPHEIAATGAAGLALDDLAVVDPLRPTARPVPRPDGLTEIEVSMLEPGALLHGLLLPAEGEAPAVSGRLDALAGLFWLLAFLAALIVSAVRIELRVRSRRSAWSRRVADGYDA